MTQSLRSYDYFQSRSSVSNFRQSESVVNRPAMAISLEGQAVWTQLIHHESRALTKKQDEQYHIRQRTQSLAVTINERHRTMVGLTRHMTKVLTTPGFQDRAPKNKFHVPLEVKEGSKGMISSSISSGMMISSILFL